jgi:RNase P subunit RPR2
MINIVGKDTSLIKRVTCKNCASILEYLPIDLKEKTNSDYDGGRYTIKCITCPSCYSQIVISST